MVFTNIEVSTCIEVEKSDEISLQNFISELKLLNNNIYDQLETKLHTNLETNYEIFYQAIKICKRQNTFQRKPSNITKIYT